MNPEKPVKVPLVILRQLVFSQVLVNVPVPESAAVAAFSRIRPVTVGSCPRGKAHPVPTVFVAVPVCAKLTILKITLLQVRVTLLVPSKLKTPPLALKIGEPEMVSAPARVSVPLGAVNVPPEIMSAPFRSDPLGSARLPELSVTVPAEKKEL